MLPQLRELERRFGDELVVIGVHSGKFTAERLTSNIQRAAQRLEISHPIVNDRQFRVWRSYAVNAWPTIGLIDIAGRLIGTRAGEVTASFLIPLIERAIRDGEATGTLRRESLVVQSVAAEADDSPLAFPSKVLATEDGYLFISDTNHHRILVVRLADDGGGGRLEAAIGSGAPGLADGEWRVAQFQRPHGVTVASGVLFVADLENHAIRAIDLVGGKVRTLAGNGAQSRAWGSQGGPGPQVALNSPWDVLYHDGALYVAMAGFHQIWRSEGVG